MPRKIGAEPVHIGIAWFDREQWQRLTEIVPDRNELDDTFQKWERDAKKALKELEREGQLVEKVPIRIEELLVWCALRGRSPDIRARSEYVSELLQKKYGKKS